MGAFVETSAAVAFRDGTEALPVGFAAFAFESLGESDSSIGTSCGGIGAFVETIAAVAFGAGTEALPVGSAALASDLLVSWVGEATRTRFGIGTAEPSIYFDGCILKTIRYKVWCQSGTSALSSRGGGRWERVSRAAACTLLPRRRGVYCAHTVHLQCGTVLTRALRMCMRVALCLPRTVRLTQPAPIRRKFPVSLCFFPRIANIFVDRSSHSPPRSSHSSTQLPHYY